MDLDYLMGQVLEYKVPLDWDAVLNSQLPLKVSGVCPAALMKQCAPRCFSFDSTQQYWK